MGGFEGGDEGGYWDEESILSSKKKKKTIETKPHIEKVERGYSIKAYSNIEGVYNRIIFVPSICQSFTIEVYGSKSLEENRIYQVYKALNDFIVDTDIIDFFSEHKVVIEKNKLFTEDMGEASCEAAAFMHLLKEQCNLMLSTDELAEIGRSVSEEIVFFIYNCSPASK